MSSFTISLALVQNLIMTQFPQWSTLTIKPVELSGWDNRTFRLGEEMLIRLPSTEAVFKSELPFDAATWDRARGWALWKALITLAALKDKDSVAALKQKKIITEIIMDSEVERTS